MKRFYLLITVTLVLVTVLSCRKSASNSGISSLTIVNALVAQPAIAITLASQPKPFDENQAIIPYGSSLEQGIGSGINPLVVQSTADTNTDLYEVNLQINPGAIYSFYLVGQGTTIDTVFEQDSIPTYSTSVAGVRFINLSPGSAPMSINLQGDYPTTTEFPNLAYKEITAFKVYPDTNGISSYNFEVRDAATGNLLYTYNWNFTPTKNYTLVISGFENDSGNNGVMVFAVNNF